MLKQETAESTVIWSLHAGTKTGADRITSKVTHFFDENYFNIKNLILCIIDHKLYFINTDYVNYTHVDQKIYTFYEEF